MQKGLITGAVDDGLGCGGESEDQARERRLLCRVPTGVTGAG